MLLFESGSGSSVNKAKLVKNDIGVYHSSETETTSPQATINSNEFLENRYESVVLDQGYALVNKNTITGPGNVGIQLIQYDNPAAEEVQAFGPKGKGTEDTITKMSGYAVEGHSDNEPGDQFGSFTITNSAISGNPPGASVSESVFSNNPSKLKIITTSTDH